ncbi:hypothetical protein ACFW6Q_26745 [Streptomyces sp. NPDC058737]|uniref:hypothetical protein n=1 Tax=Streptomyces sp. NPDC058737 TaxID=3346617 RepID=UPI0036A95381
MSGPGTSGCSPRRTKARVLHTDHPLHELSWLCAADAPPVLDTRRRSPLTKTAAPPEAGVPAAAEVTA